MASLTLEGATLGEKHKYFNKLVQETITSKKTIESTDLNSGEDDLNNLLKIDIASNNRNVDYILEVLRSEDMLYVSRAIKQCTWLITDQQYAHIINPEYLKSKLFPQMTSKATTKLIKQIKLQLKDETRCEQFYKSENDAQRAVKWLPNCSISFIEKAVRQDAKLINTRLFKRLCEKSVTILETVVDANPSYAEKQLKVTKFLLNSDSDKYLDLLEKETFYQYPEFSAKLTETVMKKYSGRIIAKFDTYCNIVHLPTFVNYLKKEDVKHFLYEKANVAKCFKFFLNFENLKRLVEAIPETERYQFVKDVFIDKIHTEKKAEDNQEIIGMRQLHCVAAPRVQDFQFYEFAPFETAFTEITKLINYETKSCKKITMIEVLVTCAGHNFQFIHKVVKYYHDKHMNDSFESKYSFINILITKTVVHKYDTKTWQLLNEIFETMNVYNKGYNNAQACIESIIVYKVLRGETVPKIIEDKFERSTLKEHQKKLNKEEKEKIFNYLYNYTLIKVQKQNVKNQEEFEVAVELLILLMEVLIDWNKDLLEFPVVLSKIKEFIKLKRDYSWQANFESLYNKKKSWRKHMFEESFELHPSEKVCINSLKHGPELLTRHKSEVEALQRNDSVSLRRLLSKLRIYWPQSLASEWTSAYFTRMDQLEGNKALTRGLLALLPRQPLLKIIQEYAPKQAKINFGAISELELSLQRQIAKNMHIARPQPSPDAILLYAKGDYLQHAMPSLLAIFYNINTVSARKHISSFINAPVSIQKHGIRFAFAKLESDELKTLYSGIWKQTNNATIRSNIFQFTFRVLSRETNPSKAKDIWGLLVTFIDALSYEEDKKIYLLLTEENVEKVPLVLRADYLMKSYKFLKNLQPKLKDVESKKYQRYIHMLVEYTREIMEYLPSDFVVEVLQEFISIYWFKPAWYYPLNLISVLSAFTLCAISEKTQTEISNKVLIPLLKQSLDSWNENNKNDFFVRRITQDLLDRLSFDLRDYVVEKNKIIPVKLFTDIQSMLNTLPVSDNYIMLTKWKLTVELTKIISKNESNDDWNVRCAKVSQEFGEKCLMYLKEDVKILFPNIFVLFSRAFDAVLELLPLGIKWDIYKHLLVDQDFIQAYLAILNLIPRYHCNEEENAAEELRKVILKHPSIEVKMHYRHKMG